MKIKVNGTYKLEENAFGKDVYYNATHLYTHSYRYY